MGTAAAVVVGPSLIERGLAAVKGYWGTIQGVKFTQVEPVASKVATSTYRTIYPSHSRLFAKAMQAEWLAQKTDVALHISADDVGDLGPIQEVRRWRG